MLVERLPVQRYMFGKRLEVLSRCEKATLIKPQHLLVLRHAHLLYKSTALVCFLLDHEYKRYIVYVGFRCLAVELRGFLCSFWENVKELLKRYK